MNVLVVISPSPAEFSQDSSRLDVAVKFIFQSSRYVVPTGRVVVPTGRYVVPAGKVIIIVSPGRLSLVPTGRILSPDSPSYTSSTYTVPSNSKTGSHRSGNVIEDVLQSFVADTEPEQQLAYEDFDQIEKLDLEEMDLKWQMAMLSVRVHKFEQKAGRKIDFDKKESSMCQKKTEIGKKEEDSKALITVDTLVDWTEHDGQSDGVITPKEFGMIAGCDTEDAIGEGAAKIYNLLTGADTKKASTAGDAGEFALMGVGGQHLRVSLRRLRSDAVARSSRRRLQALSEFLQDCSRRVAVLSVSSSIELK
ncbi:hypothetical protein Tco_0860086 [Tanacetum coccineum]|uniref:Uncharacterized protein n=1 Tax=Tanacetum coccineum TaxID=301880 RepID=A0ABQ5BJJ9_9ASTR